MTKEQYNAGSTAIYDALTTITQLTKEIAKAKTI